MGAVHTNLGGRYQALMWTAKHMGEVEFPVYHHSSKPDTNAICSVEGADPSIVAVAATFRYHTDMTSMFSMDELYMDIGDEFHPQGPRILCMYVSVTQLRYYRQTGFFPSGTDTTATGSRSITSTSSSAHHPRSSQRTTSGGDLRTWIT